MENNKQNQSNSGTSSSSSSSAANKPATQSSTPMSSASATPTASQAGSTPNEGAARQNQPSASAATVGASASQKPQAETTAPSAPSAGSQNDQQQNAQRKSWLDQEQWAKGIDQLPQSLKDFGSKAMEQVNSLSTTQKVVGGALLVSGLSWLALRSKSSKASVDSASRFTPTGDSKWNSSTGSVYRGTTARLHSSDENSSF